MIITTHEYRSGEVDPARHDEMRLGPDELELGGATGDESTELSAGLNRLSWTVHDVPSISEQGDCVGDCRAKMEFVGELRTEAAE